MKIKIPKGQQGLPTSYLQHKQDSVRNRALINFDNLETPIVPKVPNPESKEDWERNIKDSYAYFAKEYTNARKSRDKIAIQEYWRILQGIERDIENGYPIYINGPTCINTASGCYPHRVSGNHTFAGNPGKYGFVEISEKDRLPGDIVQEWIRGNPIHAMLYAGDNKFNYSAGFYDKSSLVRKGNYPTKGVLKYYRFVGNDEDKKQWEREYYGK